MLLIFKVNLILVNFFWFPCLYSFLNICYKYIIFQSSIPLLVKTSCYTLPPPRLFVTHEKTYLLEKKIISIATRKSQMLDSSRHLIDKTGLTTSFSSEDSFPGVSLSGEKLKPFINDIGSKEDENNIDSTE